MKKSNWIQRFNAAVDELEQLGISVKSSSATYCGRPMYKITKAGQAFPYKLLTATGVEEFAQRGGKFDSDLIKGE